MGTTYKANGRTFATLNKVQEYAADNGWQIVNTAKRTYKNRIVVLVNLQSKGGLK